MSGRRYPWWFGPAAVAGGWLLRLLGRSWRIEWVRIPGGEVLPPDGGRCLYAFWHARLLPLCFTHRDRNIVVLVSRHRDGELIARIVERLGFTPARGSSTRGGDEAVREMLRFAEEGRRLAISPDGPRGPACVVKPGLAYLASRTGLPVIPVAAAMARGWRLRSWDRFMIPAPFSRMVVGHGAAQSVPAGLTEEQLEAWRLRLQEAIEEIAGEVEGRVEGSR